MGNDFNTSDTTGGNEEIDINEAALGPKSITNDEGTVQERSMYEMINAETRDKGNTAVGRGVPYGIRIARTPRGGMLD